MASVTAEIALINIALDNLGIAVIQSIDPPSTNNAAIAARRYDFCREYFLSIEVWNFAKARANLPVDTVIPLGDWAYRYLLPADCLRLLSVGGTREIDQTLDYDIQGRYILSNTSTTVKNVVQAAGPLFIRYIQDVKELAQWSSHVRTALAWYLTAQLAVPLTKSQTLAQWADGEYVKHLATARAIDGQERPPLVIEHDVTIENRISLGSVGIAGPIQDSGGSYW